MKYMSVHLQNDSSTDFVKQLLEMENDKLCIGEQHNASYSQLISVK